MNSVTILATLVIVFCQIARYECFGKDSLVIDAVLNNPSEVQANSDGIDLASCLEPETNAIMAPSGQAKSRRKRYIAFPEGSSFSVKHKIWP